MCLPEYIRKKHGDQTEVEIMYEDQPSNDFNSLFLLLNGEPECERERERASEWASEWVIERVRWMSE